MRMRLSLVLALFAVAALAVACADAGETQESSGAAFSSAQRVSGFDLEGPKVLDADEVGRAGSQVCSDVVTPERTACDRVQAVVVRANGCRDLCSRPIAPDGKAAGYGLTGYAIIDADRVAGETCPTPPDLAHDAQAACESVGGITSGGNGCARLCSKPIAPAGQIAGYDGSAFRIAPSARDACEAAATAFPESCARAGGTSSRIDGCKELCTLPF
jgi:hypothetical protein